MIRLNLLHIPQPATIDRRPAPVVTAGIVLLLLAIIILVLLIVFFLFRSFRETDTGDGGLSAGKVVVCGKMDRCRETGHTGQMNPFESFECLKESMKRVKRTTPDESYRGSG